MYCLHRHRGNCISTVKYHSPHRQPLTLHRPLTEIHNEKAPIPDSLSLPVSKGTTLWVNRVYGYKKYFGFFFDFSAFVNRLLRRSQKPEEGVPKYFSRYFEKSGIHVTKIIPRRKEDGCYLFFEDADMAKKAQQLLTSTTKGRLPTHEVFLVLGEPLIEDISLLKPNKKLKVSAKILLTEDILFKLCRPYGKIREINNKTIHDVNIVFLYTSCAISARNCLHNLVEDSVNIQFRYEKPKRLQYWAWLSKQYSPLILVIFLLLLILLIEPLRLMFVFWKLKPELAGKDLDTIPGDTIRDEDIRTLLNKLPKSPLMVLSGPSESGRTQLVQRLCKNQPFTILVDFDNRKLTTGAPIDDGLLESLGVSIGYQPSFKAVNDVWAAIQIFMGAKDDMLSTSKLGQMERLLNTLGNALSWISKFPRKRKPIILFDKFNEFMERVEECSPEEQKNVSNFIKALILWSEKTSMKDGTAKIVFVGNTMTKIKMIKYAPKASRAISVFHLADLTKENAREALMKEEIPKQHSKTSIHKKIEINNEDFEVVWNIIGGRPAHLLKVKEAARDGKNIADTAKDLLGHEKKIVCMEAIGESPGIDTPSKKWTKVQFWKVIRILVDAEEDGIPHDVLVAACGGDPQPVYSLTTSNFIMRLDNSFKDNDHYTTPSPLRKATYKELLKDEGLLERIEPLETEEYKAHLEGLIADREKEIKLWKRIIKSNLRLEKYSGMDIKDLIHK